MSKEPILTVDRMGHSYGDDPVLHDVSFELRQGELLAVLGASGSGKSTLLRSIAGFVCASEGRIVLAERLLSDAGREHIPAEGRGVGLVFQDYALFPHMSVSQNIAYGLDGSVNKSERVTELLAMVNLEGLGERLPNTLSGGQKQRVALARALAPKPSILLLDEPFANLDGPIRIEVGLAVRDLLRKTGAAGVLVTHDRVEAMALADRVAVLGGGHVGDNGNSASLLQLDTPEALYLRPASAEVASLTGFVFPIEATASGTMAMTPLGEVELQEPHEGRVELLVRRHQLSFQVGIGAEGAMDCQFSGPGYRVLVDSTCGPVWIDHPERVEPGASGKVVIKGPCMAVRMDG